ELEGAQHFAREHLKTRPETLLYTYISLCDVYRELNDLETAKTHLNDALTLIRQTGRESYSGFVLENMKSLALMLDLLNDSAQADVLIDQSIRRNRRLRNEAVEKQLEALKAYMVLRRGEEMSPANRWAQSSGLSVDDKVTYLDEFNHQVFARWLIARGQAKQALPLLNRLLKAAQEANRGRTVIEILLLESLAHAALEDEAAALKALEGALVLAQPEMFVRTFID